MHFSFVCLNIPCTMYMYIPCTIKYLNVPLHTSLCLRVHKSTLCYVPLWTSKNLHVLKCTSLYLKVPCAMCLRAPPSPRQHPCERCQVWRDSATQEPAASPRSHLMISCDTIMISWWCDDTIMMWWYSHDIMMMWWYNHVMIQYLRKILLITSTYWFIR